MKRYMPLKGSLGLDMMTRTCTVQVNLDYSSEQDMVLKMRVGMALQPFVTALFAHSTQVEGQPTLYQSYRAQIWQDTDPDRCGLLPFVFEDSMDLNGMLTICWGFLCILSKEMAAILMWPDNLLMILCKDTCLIYGENAPR